MPRCPTCHRRLPPGEQCPRDGTKAPGRMHALAGMEPPELAGYCIASLIGEGGFALVWEATRLADHGLVAIKIARAATSVARHRFAKEAQALSAIGAPHVPVLHDHGVLADGRSYLVMERLHDKTLAAMLEAAADPPDVAWIRDVGDAVLASLQAVHGKQWIHRDLKPENIFLSVEPRIRALLSDFGTVRRDDFAAEVSQTAEHAVLGTAEYMAPEQLSGHGVLDARVDIYAFGILLYELLTLRVPFTGDLTSIEKGHRSLRPPRPSEFASVPPELEALCLECLAKDAERRPRDVAALRQRLAIACRDAGDALIRVRPDTASPPRLLSVSRQPVVLLAVDVPTLKPGIPESITRRKGIVARQQGLRFICAFSGVMVEKPEQVALTAAQELVDEHGARAVLHFAEVTMRPGARQRAPKLYGPAVHEPASWLPGAPCNGILLTAAMADILPEEQSRPVVACPGFHAWVPREREPATELGLFGRDDVMVHASESLRACLSSETPGLFTLIGEHGLGKSRLARAIASLVRRDHPQVRVLDIKASRRSVGQASDVYRELYRALSEHARAAAEPTQDIHGAVSRLGDQIRRVARDSPLALVIDDVHYADDLALDTVEYATLDGRGICLWIAALAHPRLDRRRPQWGRRANRHVSIELEPLEHEAAMDMAAALLRPAEFPPRAVLGRLARWTAGNPQSLAELVRTLKKRGLVRRRGQSSSWYVATAELEQLPASPVGQWLAARQLDALPSEQAACVQVCAVLGQEFTRDELAWVQSAAERDRTAATTIDTDVGLAALEEQGIITRVRGSSWAFRKASFQDAIYKLVAKRDCDHIHRSALDYWLSQPHGADAERVWACVARHAGACGAREVAADAHLAFGDRARKEHRYVEADLHYTAALAFIDPDDHVRRARALGGCGRVRYRMQRAQEAIDDLRHAEEHAQKLGDRELAVELMLEESMALDWAARFAESAQRVREAQQRFSGPFSTHLQARFLMSEGRSHYRTGRIEPAIELLLCAVELARQSGDDETCIVSLLLLAVLLVISGQVEDAEHRFDEVIALCEQTGDRLHLCVAYNNRASLWSTKRSLTNLRADLRRTIQLAREFGQPVLERSAAHNLAEFLYWSGQYDDALVLAQRAYELRRFLSEPPATDALLLARILTASAHDEQARAFVDEARHLAESGEPAVSDELVIRMLDLALAHGDAEESSHWDELIQAARERFPGEEFLEVLFFRARAALRAGRMETVSRVLAMAKDVLESCLVWGAPFEELAGEAERLGSGADRAPEDLS